MSQRSGTQCLSNAAFNWTFNSDGQSPCDVAAGLQGVCVTHVGAPVIIPPLASGRTYNGPPELLANPCICSSVYYSMLSACALCQDRQWLNWSTYNVFCTTINVQTFPSPLPKDLRVPAWAYINVAVKDTFDPTLAQNVSGRNLPDSTALPTATSTSHTLSTTQSSTSAATSIEPTIIVPTSTPLSAKSKINLGAIAGAVVGGVVVLLAILIGISIIILVGRRKRHRHRAAASEFVASNFAHGQEPRKNAPSTTKPPATTEIRQISKAIK